MFAVVRVQDLSTCGTDQFRFVGDCEGATLPPYSGELGAACVLGIEFTGTMDYAATVRFEMEASCTDTAAFLCDAEEIRALAPTPTAPVTVRWSTDVGTVMACPENPPPGIGGGCPGDTDGG